MEVNLVELHISRDQLRERVLDVIIVSTGVSKST
jgi:hypothetical protein